ncbi:MAG: protein kinase [Planctomycetia bacterium]|nr:protein kinase [Planctomycetia bacterium]
MVSTLDASLARAESLWRHTIAFQSTEQMHNSGTIAGSQEGADPSLVRQVLSRSRSRIAPPDAPDSSRVDYLLGQLLGQGGMGRVYAATQVSLDRTVAVKVMRDDLLDDCQAVALFLAEALVAAELEHPNTAPIYDIGVTHTGAPFCAMKLVVGCPWSSCLAGNTLEQNLDILLAVCDAVAFAHDRDVIHRDLKPENVMLGPYGEVLLMDWGLAASVGNPRARPLSANNILSGSPAYMAPEVAGCLLEQIGKASDIYLLGGILFEIVTGLRPHDGATLLECINAAMRNILQPTTHSGELLDIALRALRTEPAERFLTVREFQKAVQEYLAHAESLAVAGHGRRRFEALVGADREEVYRECNEIIALFKQALVAWPGNRSAAEDLVRVRQTLAAIALRRGEIQLARSHGRAMQQEMDQYHVPALAADHIAEQIKSCLEEHDREARKQKGYA